MCFLGFSWFSGAIFFIKYSICGTAVPQNIDNFGPDSRMTFLLFLSPIRLRYRLDWAEIAACFKVVTGSNYPLSIKVLY